MIIKSAAELAGEMTEAQIESVKADTRRTLALAREIELRNEQTERERPVKPNPFQQSNIPGRRC